MGTRVFPGRPLDGDEEVDASCDGEEFGDAFVQLVRFDTSVESCFVGSTVRSSLSVPRN